jgi:hypothetical protein
MITNRQEAIALKILDAICKGFEEDPGTSDLYNEQPIHVRMTLGDYRLAFLLRNEIKRAL